MIHNRRQTIFDKIIARVEISLDHFWHNTPCWLWQGPTSGKTGRGRDYPRMSLDGATVAVHIVMWTNVYGYIPYNKTIDHECKNRLCVNPHHLSMVSMAENYRRRDGKKPRKGTQYAVGLPDDLLAIMSERGLTNQFLCQPC